MLGRAHDFILVLGSVFLVSMSGRTGLGHSHLYLAPAVGDVIGEDGESGLVMVMVLDDREESNGDDGISLWKQLVN